MHIVFDIETAANLRADKFWSLKKFEAPGNYKDPEKIKAAIEEKRFDAMAKSGLTPWTGRVTCIVAFDGREWKQFFGEDEAKILSDFGIYLAQNLGMTLIGKNSKTFDVGFLVGRYIAHDMGVPKLLRGTDKPTDINDCFGYSSQGIRGSLSDYAFLMDYKGKLAHGSEAQSMYNETVFDPSKWNELVAYCTQDVAITHEFLTRYMKHFDAETLAPLTEEVIPF